MASCDTCGGSGKLLWGVGPRRKLINCKTCDSTGQRPEPITEDRPLSWGHVLAIDPDETRTRMPSLHLLDPIDEPEDEEEDV